MKHDQIWSSFSSFYTQSCISLYFFNNIILKSFTNKKLSWINKFNIEWNFLIQLFFEKQNKVEILFNFYLKNTELSYPPLNMTLNQYTCIITRFLVCYTKQLKNHNILSTTPSDICLKNVTGEFKKMKFVQQSTYCQTAKLFQRYQSMTRYLNFMYMWHRAVHEQSCCKSNFL